MKLRELLKKWIPNSVGDGLSVFTLVAFLQILYCFEVFLVLPRQYENIYIYGIHCVVATWLMLNVMGNYVYLHTTNTSIKGKMLRSDIRPLWKFCDICEAMTPPRSWHCPVCRTCILKRDHHCNFAACCVGHLNHRYFLLFLFHLTFAGLYCAYHNVIFLWHTTSFDWTSVVKLVFPLAIFVFGTETSFLQIYRILCITTILGAFTVMAIFVYYFQGAAKGLITYERAQGIKDYQLETVKENLIQALGYKWYLVWICPFINSELPNDGIDWIPVKKNTNKNK